MVSLENVSAVAHIVVKNVYSKVVETVKVVAAAALLIFAAYYLSAYNTNPDFTVMESVVLAPLVEEILFRGILQEKILHNVQWIKNYFMGPVTESDLKSQQVLRVQITSVLFALVHLPNPNSWVNKAIQCTFCYAGGSSYGYLYDRYETLAVPILLHGLNNGIVALPIPALAVYVGVIATEVFLYRFSRESCSLREFVARDFESLMQYTLPE